MRRRFMFQTDLQPMYFEAVEDGLSITCPRDMEYRIGVEGEWNTILAGESTPPVNQGIKVFFKKEVLENLSVFSTNGSFKLGGDCRSLLYGNRLKKNSPLIKECFQGLFEGTLVTEVSDDFLPATILAESCYYRMFHQCSGLKKAPKLPATELADSCYMDMFSYCSGLEKAPNLPATNLVASCYRYMFDTCSNIRFIKMLATDISATGCLSNWVKGVASTGTFVKSKDATWDTTPSALGYSGVPAGWTVITE